ncbi:predicted protein [Histoplasma capsulatum G186AR]|uniref:F-box domain-containing protein n=1 Tax=Ajellomyces capsulatus (strain G186AR / H82 / ATCC MYA-2454 / RMSCC 2432) TaxID=447093 RepID=C0NVS6_AJECG|nr:uncharacterized protein HCBG_07256 [Histoplasma capsulatum G186AR]EEH04615.1 predicted protein [Histoplasma capsulatum G186AR]
MDVQSLLNPPGDGERTMIAAVALTELRKRSQPLLITQSQQQMTTVDAACYCEQEALHQLQINGSKPAEISVQQVSTREKKYSRYRNMKANITELPIVLKQQITGHLNKKNIAHLACTCKSFHSIELCLYETVNLDVCEKAYFHVLKLSAMINKDSALAGHIKTLEIGDLRKEDTRQKLDELDELDELMKAAGWETSLSADESVAHLLSQLSSLKSFCLNRLRGEVHLTTFNFATLPTLTRLKVPAESLVSHPSPLIHRLPPTLECLYVKEANDEVNEDILPQLLIDYITATSSRLKLVSIQSYAEYWKDRAALLDNTCKNCEVKLELQYRTGMREVWNSGYMAILKTHGIEGRWQCMPLNC